MIAHVQHARIVEHGLVDGCDRCAQIAADPFVGLDDRNLADLARRTRLWMRDSGECYPRSETEAIAMRCVEMVLTRMKRLTRCEDAIRALDAQDSYVPSDVELYGAGVK